MKTFVWIFIGSLTFMYGALYSFVYLYQHIFYPLAFIFDFQWANVEGDMSNQGYQSDSNSSMAANSQQPHHTVSVTVFVAG